FGQQIAAILLVLGRDGSDLIQLEAGARERRRLHGEWLCRPGLVAGERVVGNDGALLDVVNWLPRHAIEEEQQPLLRALRDGRNLLPITRDFDQRGRSL